MECEKFYNLWNPLRCCLTLDHYDLFDRDNATRLKCFLLNNHGCRFEISFFEYINTLPHEWCVCIRVYYGTSLRQSGDSTEHNGCHNITLSKPKANFIESNELFIQYLPTIEPHEIILLLNYDQERSFAGINTIKEVILNRSWNPYNINILLDTEIRATTITNKK